MGFSPLICYTRLSPTCEPRRAAIDTVSIHCMACNGSIEVCGANFERPSTRASSNYGIGSDGRIAGYVDEDMRSYCTSSSANDHRAITIEVANTTNKAPFPVSDAAYAALIELLVDICRRHPGIGRLRWQADRNLIGQPDKQNMTVHRWFAAKSCPGDWLYERHGQIAAEANKRLEDDFMLYNDENYAVFKQMMERYEAEKRAMPASPYAAEACAKGVESGLFTDGDGDNLIDYPHAYVKRQELATVLDRKGLLEADK